jgi:hypothetical protein
MVAPWVRACQQQQQPPMCRVEWRDRCLARRRDRFLARRRDRCLARRRDCCRDLQLRPRVVRSVANA